MRIDRILAAVRATPWAIQEEKLEAISEFLDRRAEGHLTAEEIEARVGAAGRQSEPIPSSGGVAVLPIFGTISHRMGSLSSISGGTSTEGLAASFRAAMDNPNVGTIVLDIDSPGGTVSGVPELAAEIRAARGKKRVIAVANALAASAAYWLGSQAEDFVVLPSGLVGALGVYRLHRDLSGAEEKRGVRTTIIRAGTYKAEGNPHEPLSEEAKAALQEQVDDYYALFVEDVASGRGVTASEVRGGFGQGRVLTAERAKAAGMVDRIATLDDVLAELGIQTRTNHAAASSGGTVAEVIDTPEAAPEAKEQTVDKIDTAAQDRAADGGGTPAPVISISADEAVAQERQRSAEISALCKAHNIAENAEGFIAAGLSRDQVASAILSHQATQTPAPTPPAAPDISPKERRPYSFARAILSNDPDSRHVDAGYEREVSQQLARDLGRNPDGMYFSTRLGLSVPQAAGLDTATSTKGAEVVYTEPGSFIELLRNASMAIALGATVYPGLQGDVSFPRQNGAGTFSWEGENPGADVSESNLTLDTVSLTPKTGQSTTSFSRQLLAQANIDVDALVRADLATIHGLGIDLAALNGSGASNQPEGILNVTGIGDVALGANGAAPDYDAIVDLETQITQDNADIGTMAYLTTAVMRGKLKKTEEFSGSNGRPIWTGSVEGGEMNGYRAAASNQVPSTLTKGSNTDCHAIIFGVWSQLMIGEWGALDIITDPYRLKKQGMIELTSFQLVDIAVRHPEAFAAILDARNV